MTNRLENQSLNQNNNKKTDPVNIIEAVIKFQASLKELSSTLDELFNQTNTDSARLKELQRKLKSERVLWSLQEAQDHLQTIIFLAAFGLTQYVQFGDLLVKVDKGRG